MSSFRASPWVTYEPTTSHSNRRHPVSEDEMDEDVDMDAPQISTLRDEESPPPPQPQKKPTISIKRRVPQTSSGAEPWNVEAVNKDKDEVDDEEDQLIDELMDDDENDVQKPSPSGRIADTPQKRKLSVKRKPRKERKTGEGDKKGKEKVSQPTEIMNSSPMHPTGESSGLKAKKSSIRKGPAIPRTKAKVTKQKSAIPPLLLEDAGVVSESYAGTAASSPVTAQFEQNSPEPENIAPSSPQTTAAPLVEELNLENVPIPVYPLPTKPFPVQPPPKIPTGFAPLIPLDKSNKRVRHWREANREIRGIAGGRWFARTWVGDKDSEYASHVASISVQTKSTEDKSAPGTVALPKLSSVPIPATASNKTLGKLKVSAKGGSTATSTNPSRAPSTNPETQGIAITNTVRAPTKMRILQLAPSSDAGDSDNAVLQPVVQE